MIWSHHSRLEKYNQNYTQITRLPMRMAKSKETPNTKFWQNVEPLDPSYTDVRSGTLHKRFGKQCGKVL